METKDDDVAKYTEAELQRKLDERGELLLASMQKRIDLAVAAKLEELTLSSPPNTNASVGLGTNEGTSPSFPKSAVKSYNAVGHEYPNSPIQMPHMAPSGAPPLYDGSHFSYWKSSMESYLRSISKDLWDVVEFGYKPVDLSSLTPRECVSHQLNSTARDKIRHALPRSLCDQVHRIDSAKDLWDGILILPEGTSLIQRTNYDCAKREMGMFIIKDGESLANAY